MGFSDNPSILGVYCPQLDSLSDIQDLLNLLQLPLLDKAPACFDSGHFVVKVDVEGVALYFTGPRAPNPIRVDFIAGASAHRRHFGGGKGQLIAKAVGIKGHFRPQITDLTAGLGADAFVLATLGCSVTCVERVPVIFQLLQDGLKRANDLGDMGLKEIMARMTCYHQDSMDYINQLETPAEVVYLDPMFPERGKAAQVKKAMVAFQSIVGKDRDAGQLLVAALNKAKYRVVVKRPRKALTIAQQYPELALPEPGLVLSGKSSRFDIYPLAKLPS